MISTDITDQVERQARLRVSEARYRAIVEDQTELVCRFSPDGSLTFVNQAYCRFAGKTAEQLIGTSAWDLIHHRDREWVLTSVASMSRAHAVDLVSDRRAVAADGEVYWYDWTFRALFDDDGEIFEFQAVGSDVTQRKQVDEELAKYQDHLEDLVRERTRELEAAQESLMRQERLATIGQLTATVSHELRNPLGSLRASVAAIKNLAPDDASLLRRAVDIADRSINRCDTIIGELLDFTRSHALARQPTMVDDWLTELLDEYPLPSQITLRRDLDAGGRVDFDCERLRRLLINLLDNACQAMTPDRGPEPAECLLTVASRISGGAFELTVSDTGLGIAAEHSEKVFEPLFSTKSFGIGLGLPIAKQIAEQHGGALELTSVAGVGTSATLRLPLRAAPGARG